MPPIINAAATNKPPSARMLPEIGAPMRVSSPSTGQFSGSMRAKKLKRPIRAMRADV